MQAETGPPPSPDEEAFDAAEVIDLEVRESRGRYVAEAPPDSSFARTAGEKVMSLWIYSVRGSFRLGRAVFDRAADSSVGRLVGDAAAGAMSAVTKEISSDWDQAGQRAEDTIGQVISIVVPVVVQSLDPEELMEYLDINAILETVDVNAILDQVEVDALLDRVEVDRLLDRVDVDGLMGRADVDALVSRVDVNELMSKVDLDALLEKVDVAAIAKRAKVGELVAESTSDVAGSALDVGRRQAVAVDTVLARTVNRVLGRDSETMPRGPQSLIDPAEEAGNSEDAET